MNLLEMSLSGTVFILAVLAVRAAAVHYLPKKTFLVLWGVALVHLLLPVRIPSSLSIYSRIPGFVQKADTQQAGSRNGEAKASKAVSQGRSEGSTAYGDEKKGNAFEGAFDGAFDGGKRLAVQGGLRKTFGIIWAAGFGVCLAVFAAVYAACIRRFHASMPVKNEFVEGWLREQQGRRHIQVRQSGFVKAPITYGIFRPVIVMPKQTDWEDTKQLRYILAHEAVHIRRLDAAAKLLLAAALAVHWFNPFVWLMYAVCNRDLELSCDETVVRAFGENTRAEYARILIGMEERKSMPLPLCSGFCRNVMQERIVAIMKIQKKSKAAVIAAAAVVGVLAAVFATSSADVEGQNPSIKAQAQPKKISNISLNLSNQAAEEISDAVITHMEKEYEGFYKLENFELSFCNEVVEDDTLSLDIEVGADMTNIRDPKDSPYVQGMREAMEQIEDAAKKKSAQKLYDEYLEEMMQYYQVPEETGFSYQVHLPAAQAAEETVPFSYELFYLHEDGGLTPFQEDDHVQPHLGKEDGKAYIEDNI
ncbi:MAG: M56 family metallopeptidase [Eubacterium sp.]|nr:M56 family metallopeptidase [Eubacterium sp.]